MNETTPAVVVRNDVFGKLPRLLFISGRADFGTITEEQKASIGAYLGDAWRSLEQALQTSLTPEARRIEQWVAAFKEAGISTKKFPPSIHAIAKRVVKGGEPFRINPVVDLYNAISMDLALPLGAYAIEDLRGDLGVRLSPGGEDFVTLGSAENEPTESGEIVLADDAGVLTRMFLWRQAQRSKITEQTTSFFFVCELLREMGGDIVERAQQTIREKFSTLLGASVSGMTVQRAS